MVIDHVPVKKKKNLLNCFPEWLYHFRFPNSDVRELQFLHIIINTWYCQSKILGILLVKMMLGTEWLSPSQIHVKI